MTGAPADLDLKLRIRRLFFLQGYWSPIEVELSHYEHLGTALKRQSLTDVDVLGVRIDPLFVRHTLVADCKTGRNVSDTNRLFWLRGVMAYFRADEAYFVRPQIAGQARAVAPKMGLRVVDAAELLSLEKRLETTSLKLPLADIDIHLAISRLWGIDLPKGQAPTSRDLELKALYSYLSYSYWYADQHRNLLNLIGKFEQVAHLLDAQNPRHVLLCYVGAERLAHCLLQVAVHVQAQGTADIPRYARIYIYGGSMALREKEQFFTLLRKATGSTESLDPPWLQEALELLGRLLRNPSGSSDVLRELTGLYLWCAYLGNKSSPDLGGSAHNTAALVLAKDVAATLTRAAGLPEAMFEALKQL